MRPFEQDPTPIRPEKESQKLNLLGKKKALLPNISKVTCAPLISQCNESSVLSFNSLICEEMWAAYRFQARGCVNGVGKSCDHNKVPHVSCQLKNASYSGANISRPRKVTRISRILLESWDFQLSDGRHFVSKAATNLETCAIPLAACKEKGLRYKFEPSITVKQRRKLHSTYICFNAGWKCVNW